MQKSPAPVIVRAHAEYDDSPEQVKVLSHIPPNQKISGTGHTTAECSKPVVKASKYIYDIILQWINAFPLSTELSSPSAMPLEFTKWFRL